MENGTEVNRMEQRKPEFVQANAIRRKSGRVKHRVVSSLAAVVVFCTVYALILPAITLNHTPECGLAEHVHGEACYTENRALTCTIPEHTHTDVCWGEERVLICDLEESPGHTHNEACYQEVRELVCGLEEGEDHTHTEECWSVHKELICEQEESEGHTHSDACYETRRVLLCGLEEHSHEDACFEVVRELTCGIPEHIHSDACYHTPESTAAPAPVETSDPTADLESRAMWEASLASIKRTGRWSEDVLSVARSQINYSESRKNYILGSDGTKKGYSRYGAWYGAPYGDWCAMFVSFCLNYAGVRDFPLEASPARWVKTLQDAQIDAWRDTDTYTPLPGDLIFFDLDLNGVADHVGLVETVKNDAASKNEFSLTTIEGNYSNAVKQAKYSMADERILGYGALPENPDLQREGDELLAAGDYYVWFDGTEGLGTMQNYYQGATNTRVLATQGRVTLPTSAGTPANGCVLNGWYDIKTGTYYGKERLGTEITVSQNTVFYADWVPANDDYLNTGRTTVQSADTAGFVRSELFDYNELVNMLSASHTGTVNQGSHSETWSLNGSKPFNFTFYQWAYNNIAGDTKIGALANLNERNRYGGEANDKRVIQGIVSSESDDILQTLFTDSGTPGVRKVGEGPGLFQFDQSTGYYYYDSNKNGAAYQASEGRFYVYSDVTRIRGQDRSGNSWTYNNKYTNAFMPLNTQSVVPEKNGQGNFWFGMKTTIDFFLPEAPGTNNGNCNYSSTGDPMVFRFSGDDDVWVFVDGVPVLDLGGIHGIVDGAINFSAGTVTYTDYYGRTQTKSLPESILQGEHKLTMYYLERGSSASNCSIYFNIAPRYGLELTKKDRETQHLLNGAEFSVFLDENCTIPAQLWNDKASFETGEASSNTFTVVNGKLNCWGLSPGRTYYIKETKPPENGYSNVSATTIALTLDSRGAPSVQVLNPSDYLGVTDVIRDSEIQKVSMTIDNLKPPSTTIRAEKLWLDADGELTNQGVPIQLQLYYSKVQQQTPSPLQTHQVSVFTQHFSADGKGGGNSDTNQIIPADYSETLTVQNGSDLIITLNSLTSSAGFYSVTANGVVITPENVTYGTENCYIGGQWGQHPIASARYTIPAIEENKNVVITLIGWPEWENGRVVMAKTMSASFSEVTHTVETPEPIEIPDELPADAVAYGDPVTVYPDENGNWYYEWADLPWGDGNEVYYYYVQELPLDGYETSYSGNGTQEGTITVTNRELDDGLLRLRLLKNSSESGNPLSGASFDLYRAAEPGEPGVSLPGLDGKYVKVNESPIITGQDGRATIGGLEEGTYYLVETEAPTGFALDPTPHRIELTASSAQTDPGDEMVIGSGSAPSVTVSDEPKVTAGDLVVEKRWYETLPDGSGRIPTEPRSEEIRYQIHRSYVAAAEGIPFTVVCKDLAAPQGTVVLQGVVAPGTSFRFYACGVNNSWPDVWNRPSYSCEGGSVRLLTGVTEPISGYTNAPVYEVTAPASSEGITVTLDWTGITPYPPRYRSYRSGYPDSFGPQAPTGGGETVEELVTVVIDNVETDTFTLNEANNWIQTFQRNELNETPGIEYTYWVEELEPEEDWTVAYHTETSPEFADRVFLVIDNTVGPPEPIPDAPTLHKEIDYLGDGDTNPDTTLEGGSCYRLYLTALVEEWSDSYYLSELVDELSAYVSFYSEQPDVKVVWTDDSNVRHVVWENGSPTAENVDAEGRAIVQAVTYDNVQSETSTGRVRLIFNPACVLPGSNSFELSFNVSLTGLAAEEYDAEGYNAEGDLDTDFGENTTSSGQAGFHSNDRAWMTWYGNGKPYETEYEHPVVQVQPPQLEIRKQSAVDGSALAGAGFNLYKDCSSDTEGAVLIPGSAGCFGLKQNDETLVTDDSGRLTAMELEPGTYYLVETAAPNGFYAPSKPIAFTVARDGVTVLTDSGYANCAVVGDTMEDGTFVLIVENKSSLFLPETGGSGYELYMFGGTLLITAALMCIYMILRERRKREKNISRGTV